MPQLGDVVDCMTQVAFVIGGMLALVVTVVEGWTTGHVSGQWLHDSVNRRSEEFSVSSATKRLLSVEPAAGPP